MKSGYYTMDNHQVVGDHFQHDLAVDRKRPSSPKRRAEPSLHHRKRRLYLPALPVLLLRKTLVKLPPVFSSNNTRCPVIPGPSAAGGGNDAFQPQLLAAETMYFFAFVTGVAQKRTKLLSPPSLLKKSRKLHYVRLRAAIDHRSQYQVSSNVAERRELRIPPLPVTTVPPTSLRIVHRDMPRLKTGRVHGGGAAFGFNQAAATGEFKSLIKEPRGAPFFSRRSSA